MESSGHHGNLQKSFCSRSTELSGTKTIRERTKVRRELQGYESSRNRSLNETGPNCKRQSAEPTLLARPKNRKTLRRLHETFVSNCSNGALLAPEHAKLTLTTQKLRRDRLCSRAPECNTPVLQ